jgi:hypothetical protein
MILENTPFYSTTSIIKERLSVNYSIINFKNIASKKKILAKI